MTATTLSVLALREDVLRRASEYFKSGDRGDPTWLILLAAVAVMTATAYYAWGWLRRLDKAPTSRTLLRLAADRVGLSAAERRLLWRIARAAGHEPAMALVSPSLLTHIVNCGTQAGRAISADQQRMIGRILDAVTVAAQAR